MSSLAQLNFTQILRVGFRAGLTSSSINLSIFAVAKMAGIITDDVMVQPGEPLTWVPVLMASLVPSVLGALVFMGLQYISPRAYSIFLVLALVLLAASMANPFLAIPNVPTNYAMALDAMHIPVCAFLLLFLKRELNALTK